jgi:hypothetical protein
VNDIRTKDAVKQILWTYKDQSFAAIPEGKTMERDGNKNGRRAKTARRQARRGRVQGRGARGRSCILAHGKIAHRSWLTPKWGRRTVAHGKNKKLGSGLNIEISPKIGNLAISQFGNFATTLAIWQFRSWRRGTVAPGTKTLIQR